MSTMSQDRFNNPKYLDWVKVKLSLQYAKEGLQPSTNQKVQTFHDNLSSTLQAPSSSSASAAPTLCHACLKTDLKRQWSRQRFSCLGGTCDGWLGLLQQNHVDPTTTAVEWDNFDVSRLPTSPWECAKVYMPYGSGKVNCAGDADLAAILTLFLNCRHFASSLQNVTVCEKVKEVRNRLLHSGTMEEERAQMLAHIQAIKQLLLYLSSSSHVASPSHSQVKEVRNRLLHSGTMNVERAQMLADIQAIKQLLGDPAFATDTACQEATSKIDKLLRDKLELSQNKELELAVLNGDIKSVTDKTDHLRTELSTLKDQLDTEVTSLNDKLDTEVTSLNDKLDTEVTSLNDKLDSEVSGLNKKLDTEIGGVNTEMTSLKNKLDVSLKDIVELQKVADLLCRFINNCKIDKVDIGQLAASISTLSALRAETDRQGQILAQLQETVSRHEVTLEQHGGTLEQHKRKLNILESDIQAKKGRSDRQNPEMTDIAALQQHLIAVYKHDCKWENPVTTDQEKSVTISQMYVEPQIKMVRQRNQKDCLVEVEQRQQEKASQKLTYKQILYTRVEQCQNIYVTGNAGMGKTTYCKQLLHTWCKAVQNISEEGDSAEDLSVLKEFRLLFYVNMREAESLYHVEDMIGENILHDAPTEYNVSDILKTEKCLVVLDGLDEWSCPQGAKICRGLNKDIPGRNIMNKNSVYLTTTRNWKFDVIDLKSKDCDKQVELCGIGENSSKELAKKTICKLNPDYQYERPINDFFKEVQKKQLDILTQVPVLLIQLLTLWYFCKDLGKSQVQLYCRMLDILLEQAKKHLSDKSSTVTKPVQTDAELPGCFSEEEDNCCNHTQLLLCLSQLAFMSLLNKKKEDSLVFKSSRLEVCGIGSSDIRLCLKCGIFTQNKALRNPTGRYKKYSFIHKKLQEFLAAMYLVTSKDIEKNLRQVREYCDKLDTTLEMGQVFMFVCGMNAEVGNHLMHHLTSVVSEDKNVQNSRQSVVIESLIKDIQVCVMACVTEGASNGLTVDVHLQDHYLDRDTISDYINHVVEIKNTSIKSEYINMNQCSKKHVTVVLKNLQKVQTLEKLWLDNNYSNVKNISMLASVLTPNVSTLQSLCLGGVNLADDEALFAAVLGCVPSLQALSLGGGDNEEVGLAVGKVHVSHGQREQLLAAATSHLTHLGLHLYCTDHRAQCRPVLDLSGHTQLQTLCLMYMSVSNLNAVAGSVEKIVLYSVTVAHSTLRQFIEALEQSSNKVEVDLYNVTVTEDSGDPADTAVYIRDCDKFTVEVCDIIGLDKRWHWVLFHKK